MNIKALITTLVIGSSSIALADPSWQGGVQVSGNGNIDAGVVIRDHRGYEPAPAPATVPSYRPRPIYTTPIAPLRQTLLPINTTRDGRTYFHIGGRACSEVELSVLRGSAFVDKVEVLYSNGQKQFLEFDQAMRRSSAPIRIATNRNVTNIVVFGRAAGLKATLI